MEPDICWIDTINKERASRELFSAYDAVGRSDGSVHNMYRAYDTRPDLMVLADRFYRELLHSERRTLDAWVQELIATYVAILNSCAYARDNHGANFKALLGDDVRGERILTALNAAAEIVDEHDMLIAILQYVRLLTLSPETIEESAVHALRAAGLHDAQIFEVNQIAANFAYWTRVLNGLGVRASGEKVGLYDQSG